MSDEFNSIPGENLPENDENALEEGDIIEMIETRKDFDRAMSFLNERQRELLHALFVEGISQEEYAKETGVDQSAIAHQLQTVRKKLKKVF